MEPRDLIRTPELQERRLSEQSVGSHKPSTRQNLLRPGQYAARLTMDGLMNRENRGLTSLKGLNLLQ